MDWKDQVRLFKDIALAYNKCVDVKPEDAVKEFFDDCCLNGDDVDAYDSLADIILKNAGEEWTCVELTRTRAKRVVSSFLK